MEAWAARDFDRVVKCSNATLPLLDPVVEEVVATRGEFWHSTPPAITYGAQCMTLAGDSEGLAQMRDTLSARPELQQWLPDVDGSGSPGPVVLTCR